MPRALRRACWSLSLLLALASLVAGCKSVEVPKVPGITPYRMEIQQGNYISQEMVAQLKPGLTREQVRFILGTPLVTDIFHANRWDFVFFRERPNGKREQRSLSVIFEDNKLARVIGDLLPTEPAVARPEPKSEAKPAAVAKPAAEVPKPAAEVAKPPASGQNWRAASDEPPAKP